MTPLATVRAFALLDLVVTGLLAVPWLADVVLAVLVTWGGLDGSPADVLPLAAETSVFLNLAGVLGVLWNGRRFLAPMPDLVRWDLWGRVAVSVLFVGSVVLRDAPTVLLVFVVTELGGALAARRYLTTRT